MTDQEINEAVARKLGWFDSDYPVKGKGWIKRTRLTDQSMFDYLDKFPDYCHSIEAAWEIVESLRAKGMYIGVSTAVNDPVRWICGINGMKGKDDSISDGAATAPMAICLAFLKLVETPAGGASER